MRYPGGITYLILGMSVLISCDRRNDSIDVIERDCTADSVLNSSVVTIMEDNCVRCHSPGSGVSTPIVDITDTAALIDSGRIEPGKSSESFLYTKATTDMPPDGLLASSFTDDIKTWIDSMTCVTRQPGDIVNENVTFSQVKAVLQAQCSDCHTGGNSDGGANFDTYQGVRAHVSLGSATLSPIYRRIENGSMPPPSSGKTFDDPSGLQLIKDWINSGALDN